MFGFHRPGRAAPATKTAAPRRIHGFEQLEPRTMLAAAGLSGLVAHPLAVTPANGNGLGYVTPAEISHAYGFDQVPAPANGATANGAGQTIAIVDSSDDPTIAGDLQVFDQANNLAAPPSFRKVDQTGGTNYPAVDPNWTPEIAIDVEWAHAMAPGANILLVETNTGNLSDLLAGIDYARNQPGVSVVSMSWDESEFSQEAALDSYFTTPANHQGVTFVAATGDTGAPASWPAVSPNVLAIGGTTLQTLDAQGDYRSESGWSGGGGGFSLYESEPSYQNNVQHSGSRTIPDVAYDADPNTGFMIYSSTGPGAGWSIYGGTSIATPQWAALVAIANQERTAAGYGTLRNAEADAYLLPASDFHDVASGDNGFTAGPGYDLVTGRGTPYANRIIHDLSGGVIKATEPAAKAAGISAAAARSILAAARSHVAATDHVLSTVVPEGTSQAPTTAPPATPKAPAPPPVRSSGSAASAAWLDGVAPDAR